MNYPRVERFVLKLTRLFVLAAIFTPLLYTVSTLFPFIVGKVVYLQAVVGLALGAYLMLLVLNFNWLPRPTLLLKTALLYIVALFISTLTGIDFLRSFWANFERMTGWFALLHYFLLFVIAASVFPDKVQRARLLKTTLFVSLLVSLSAFYSLIKPGFLFQTGDLAKLWGTLGNSIYLGNYMSVHLFFAGLLYLESEKKSTRIFALVVGAIDIFAFAFAETRGAMLGFLAAVAVMVIFSLFAVKNKKIKTGVAAFFVMAALFGTVFYFNQRADWVQSVPGLRRLAGISFTGGTMATRFIAWNIAFEAWKEKPVFGWGPENYYYAFNKYYNPKSLEFSYYETWFDRAHNVVFDHLVFAGAVGLLSYLSIFAVALYALFKRWREGKLAYGLFILTSGFFITAFVQKLTVFDEPSSYLVFFVGLAYAQTLLSDPHEKKPEQRGVKIEPRKMRGGVFFIAAIVIIIMTITLVYAGSIRTFTAGQKLLLAEAASQGGLAAALPKYEEALSYGTAYIKDTEHDYLKRVSELLQNGGADGQIINRAVQLAERASENTIKEHPRDVYGYLLIAQLYTILGYYDAKYTERAEWAYSKASELSPKRQQVYYSWGRLRLARRDYAGALEVLQRALDDNPRIADSHWYVGLASYMAGDMANAKKEMEAATALNYQWKSPHEASLVGDVFVGFKEWEKAVAYYEKALSLGAQAETYYHAARAYLMLGERVKARDYATKSLETVPDNLKPEIKQFLNSF